jgi:hypothetical protein
MKRVFFSCVSNQFKKDRSALQQFATTNQIEIKIQEDFEESASPYGTLVKIYEHLRDVDLVVHLIGSHPPVVVPKAMIDELYRHDPNFGEWMSRQALDEKSATYGYTDWEAYMALYFDRPFLPIFYGNGTQPKHVARLHRLGRHVECKAWSLKDIESLILEGLAKADRAERTERQRNHSVQSVTSTVWLVLWVVLCLSLTAILQLAVAPRTGPSGNEPASGIATVCGCWVAFVALQVMAMHDELAFAFRIRVAARTATPLFLLSAVVGRFCVTQDSPAGYWVSIVVGWLLLGLHTAKDTKALEKDRETADGRSKPRAEWSDHYYWTRRNEVVSAFMQSSAHD